MVSIAGRQVHQAILDMDINSNMSTPNKRPPSSRAAAEAARLRIADQAKPSHQKATLSSESSKALRGSSKPSTGAVIRRSSSVHASVLPAARPKPKGLAPLASPHAVRFQDVAATSPKADLDGRHTCPSPCILGAPQIDVGTATAQSAISENDPFAHGEPESATVASEMGNESTIGAPHSITDGHVNGSAMLEAMEWDDAVIEEAACEGSGSDNGEKGADAAAMKDQARHDAWINSSVTGARQPAGHVHVPPTGVTPAPIKRGIEAGSQTMECPLQQHLQAVLAALAELRGAQAQTAATCRELRGALDQAEATIVELRDAQDLTKQELGAQAGLYKGLTESVKDMKRNHEQLSDEVNTAREESKSSCHACEQRINSFLMDEELKSRARDSTERPSGARAAGLSGAGARAERPDRAGATEEPGSGGPSREQQSGAGTEQQTTAGGGLGGCDPVGECQALLAQMQAVQAQIMSGSARAGPAHMAPPPRHIRQGSGQTLILEAPRGFMAHVPERSMARARSLNDRVFSKIKLTSQDVQPIVTSVGEQPSRHRGRERWVVTMASSQDVGTVFQERVQLRDLAPHVFVHRYRAMAGHAHRGPPSTAGETETGPGMASRPPLPSQEPPPPFPSQAPIPSATASPNPSADQRWWPPPPAPRQQPQRTPQPPPRSGHTAHPAFFQMPGSPMDFQLSGHGPPMTPSWAEAVRGPGRTPSQRGVAAGVGHHEQPAPPRERNQFGSQFSDVFNGAGPARGRPNGGGNQFQALQDVGENFGQGWAASPVAGIQHMARGPNSTQPHVVQGGQGQGSRPSRLDGASGSTLARGQ